MTQGIEAGIDTSIAAFMERAELPGFATPGYVGPEHVVAMVSRVIGHTQVADKYRLTVEGGSASPMALIGDALSGEAVATMVSALDMFAPIDGGASWQDTVAVLAAQATSEGVGIASGL